MKSALPCLIACAGLLGAGAATAGEFRHVGDYLLKSRIKLTGGKTTPIAIKPVLLKVYTDGIEVRVSAEGDDEARTTFEVYRSDGIGHQRTVAGALEVIPGLQAMGKTGGVLRHLRLSRESLTITTFPGVSDQTIVTYAVAAEKTPAASVEAKPAPADPTHP